MSQANIFCPKTMKTIENRNPYVIYNSLKGHSVAPAHPDGLPKEQGVKRAKYFHTREGSKK